MKAALIVLAIAIAGFVVYRFQAGNVQEADWTADFFLEPNELTSIGSNPYFSLVPGHVQQLEEGTEKLVITVLDETRMVDGVETRIVEERESVDGALVEVSRNYYAISRRTNAVFYFGEEVDIYKDGRIVDHEGAWESGKDGARFGLMMPGTPLVRGRHYQEIAPGVAMDRAEIVSVTDSLTVPAGAFGQVVRIAETTPIEPGIVEYKYYAPGVGLLQDGDLKLVSYGMGVRR